MAGKYNTIIFVPHARAKFRKLRISNRALWGAAVLAALVLVSAILFASIFFLSVRRDRLYRQTLAENERLKVSAEKMTVRLSDLSRRLDDFEVRTRKLAIVAGMPALADTGRGGTGGALPAGDASVDLVDRSNLMDTRLTALEKRIAQENALLANSPTIEPVHGLVTSAFGGRSDPFTEEPGFHTGIDIASQRDHPVIATGDGTVVQAGWVNGYGRCVEISHGMGIRTLYAHLDEIKVIEGQRVTRGEVVGLLGSTGRSTGPHVHYEVRLDNRPVNPLQFFLDRR